MDTEEKHEEPLFETEPFETDEAPAETPAAEPEEKSEPARDEKGKFAKKAEEAPAQPEPEVQPEARTEQPMVPLAALHEVRDELKAFKAEAERQRQAQQPEPTQPPDMFEDPEGWQTYQQQQFQTQLYAQRLDMSRRFAEQQHGKESVDAAVQWGMERCNSDPYFNQMVASQTDPVGFVVQQFNRDQIASSVDMTEFEQFQAWKKAQAEAGQAAPQPQSTPQPKPPKSIASAPSAGGVQQIAMGEQAVFDEEFK